jgi:hypothetical protein
MLLNVSAFASWAAFKTEESSVGVNVPPLKPPLDVGLLLMKTSYGSSSNVPMAPFGARVSVKPV